MSDPRTPNISLWLPVHGERNWDIEVNQNWQLIDTAVGQLIAGSSNWHFTGAWQPLTNYTINQVVTYLGGSYLALANFTSGATFGTGVGETWGQIASPGTSLNFRGAWSNVTAYNPYDLVTEAGSMYLALLAGTGHDPSSSPTFWALVAQSGATGATGATGSTGATGATGPAGTGASSFNQITAGTNLNQTLNVGNGSLLQPQGTGVINANEIGGVVAVGGPTPALGKLLIAQGDGTAVWADPLCQGIQADGTAASTINPILVSGKGADNNQHNLKTDNTGVLQTHESGTATVHVDATTLAPVAIAGPVQVTDGLNHYQPTGDDPARTIHVTLDNTPSVTLSGGSVNQGTPGSIGNSWFVEVTDGTNVLGTSAHPVVTSNTSTVTPGQTTDPATLLAIAAKTVGGTPTYNPVPLTSDAQAVNVNIHASEVGDAAEAAPGALLPSKTIWVGASDNTNLQGLKVDGSGNLKVVASGVTSTQYTGSPVVAAGSVVSTLASGYDGTNVRPLLISNTGVLSVSATGTVTVSGSVTANIGTTGGLALDATLTGGTAKTQMYDGTNVIGTSAHPVQVSLANTAANATAIKVDGSGVTQPISGSISFTAPQHVIIDSATLGTVTVSGTVTATVASVGATGSAVPASADYIGVNVGGNTRGVTGINTGGSNYAPMVAVVDATGTQITSFGGGTQYAHGTSISTPTGTVAMGLSVGNVVYALATDPFGNITPSCTGGGGGNASWTSATTLNSVVTTTASYALYFPTTLITLEVSGTITGGVITFECFGGSGTYFPVSATRVDSGIIDSTFTLATGQTQSWVVDATGFQICRVRLSTVLTGGGTAAIYLKSTTAQSKSPSVVGLAAGSNVIGHVITDTGSTTAVTGTVTVSGTVAVSNAFALDATLTGGTQKTQITDGTNALGTFANYGTSPGAVKALQTNAFVTNTVTVSGTVAVSNSFALDSSVNGILVAQASTTSGQSGPLVQSATTTSAPTYTTAKTNPLSSDTSGNLRVSLKDTPSNTNNLNVNLAASAATVTVSGTVAISNSFALDASVTGLQVAQGSTTSGQKGELVQGAVTTSAPTYTTGQTSPLSLDTTGALRVAGSFSAGIQSDRTATGSITSTQNVAISTQGCATAFIMLSGTWTGTVTFEGLEPDGATWQTVNAVSCNGTNATPAISATSNGLWQVMCAGNQQLRVRGNTVASGTTTVNLEASVAYSQGQPFSYDGSGRLVVLAHPDSGTFNIQSNATVDLNKVAGTATDTNSGVKSAGTLRVVLATDQPALTNKLLVTPDSVALPAHQSTNVDQLNGTTTDTNSGTKSAGTLRVVLATDQPALTNKLLVTPDSVALPANQSVNVSQINAVTPLMGNGTTGTGSQRVTIASDNTAFAVNATLSAETTKVVGTVRNIGNAGAAFDAATAASVPANAVQQGVRAATANPTAVTDGQLVAPMADKLGRQAVVLNHVRNMVVATPTTITNSSAATSVMAAQGANVFADIVTLVITQSSGTASTATLSDGTNSYIFDLAATIGTGLSLQFPTPIPATTANTAWTIALSSAAITVHITVIAVKNL